MIFLVHLSADGENLLRGETMTETNVDVFAEEEELATIEINRNYLVIEKTPFLEHFALAYRKKLITKYKQLIFESYDDSINTNLMDQLILKAAMVIDSSEEEIIELFFDDARNQYAGMEDEDFFNGLFEEATQFP